VNLKQITALGLRCCSLYLLWQGILFLVDYYRASLIFNSLQPGGPLSDSNGAAYLQGKYGNGVSLELCHTILGYCLEYIVAAILLWCFSIPLARLLTRNLETA
jgi:hypothetical protein